MIFSAGRGYIIFKRLLKNSITEVSAMIALKSRWIKAAAYAGALTGCMVLALALFFTAAMAGEGPAAAPRMTPQELKAMLDGGKEVVILDVRSAGSYNSSRQRIKNDVRMPLGDISEKYAQLTGDKTIVAYCT